MLRARYAFRDRYWSAVTSDDVEARIETLTHCRSHDREFSQVFPRMNRWDGVKITFVPSSTSVTRRA